MNTKRQHLNSVSKKTTAIVRRAWKEYLDYVSLTYDLKRH